MNLRDFLIHGVRSVALILVGFCTGILIDPWINPDQSGKTSTANDESPIVVDIPPIEESPVWLLDENGWTCIPGSAQAEADGVCEDAEQP